MSRPMRTSVTSIKGGVGKSVITLHLAVMLALDKKKAVVLDLDIQGTANDAYSYAEDPIIDVVTVHDIKDLRKIEADYKDYDYIFYDMPRISVRTDTEYMALIKSLDAIVVPFRGSLIDYSATVDFVEILQDIGYKPLAGAKSMYDYTRDFKNASFQLENLGLEVLRANIPRLQVLAEAHLDKGKQPKEFTERFQPFYKNWKTWINSQK